MQTATLKPLTLPAVRQPPFRSASMLLAAVTVSAALAMRPYVTAWCEMFLVALVLFANFKWLTWTRRTNHCDATSRIQAIGYSLAWVGLDADEFCSRSVPPTVRACENGPQRLPRRSPGRSQCGDCFACCRLDGRR